MHDTSDTLIGIGASANPFHLVRFNRLCDGDNLTALSGCVDE
jgi:hypothetical protein